jgi:hypothetical protein
MGLSAVVHGLASSSRTASAERAGELSDPSLSGIAEETEQKGKTVQMSSTPVALPDVPLPGHRPGSTNRAADPRRDEIRHPVLALPPGTRLSEAETGARFGASRTPVREAMTWLRDEGLIVTMPSRGNFVTFLSEDGIRSAQFIREALEVAAIVRICETGLRRRTTRGSALLITAQRNAISFEDRRRLLRRRRRLSCRPCRGGGTAAGQNAGDREKTALDRLRGLCA